MLEKWSSIVLDSIFDIIIVVDEKLNIADVNNAVREIGYSKEELIGQSVLDLIVDGAGFRKSLGELILEAKKGTRSLRRFEAIRKDSGRIFVDVAAREIETTDNVDYLITLHDVTERALARKELEEQKTKIELVLKETESLRKEADENRIHLQIANRQLEDRQQATEEELKREQMYRLTAQRTDFQRNFAIIMSSLVAFALILPYSSALFAVSEKLIDTTGNLSLLLIQTLGIIAGALFQQGRKDGNGGQ